MLNGHGGSPLVFASPTPRSYPNINGAISRCFDPTFLAAFFYKLVGGTQGNEAGDAHCTWEHCELL